MRHLKSILRRITPAIAVLGFSVRVMVVWVDSQPHHTCHVKLFEILTNNLLLVAQQCFVSLGFTDAQIKTLHATHPNITCIGARSIQKHTIKLPLRNIGSNLMRKSSLHACNAQPVDVVLD